MRWVSRRRGRVPASARLPRCGQPQIAVRNLLRLSALECPGKHGIRQRFRSLAVQVFDKLQHVRLLKLGRLKKIQWRAKVGRRQVNANRAHALLVESRNAARFEQQPLTSKGLTCEKEGARFRLIR